MPVSRILCPHKCAGGVHSSRPFVAERLKRPTRKRGWPFGRNRKRTASISFPYLALHREEFAWPNMLPRSPVSSYLTVSPITFEKAGLFSVALVVNRSLGRPDVIRLAALWCSDFPLSHCCDSERPARSTAWLKDYSKKMLNNKQTQELRLSRKPSAKRWGHFSRAVTETASSISSAVDIVSSF